MQGTLPVIMPAVPGMEDISSMTPEIHEKEEQFIISPKNWCY